MPTFDRAALLLTISCLRSLTGILVATILCWSLPVAAQVNGVFREVYENIGGGTAVSDLTSAPSFPNSPTSTNFIRLEK